MFCVLKCNLNILIDWMLLKSYLYIICFRSNTNYFCVLKYRTPACVLGVQYNNCRRLLLCKTFYINNKNENAFLHDKVKNTAHYTPACPHDSSFLIELHDIMIFFLCDQIIENS